MSESKHTKGPWDLLEDTDGSILIKTKGAGSFREVAVILSDVPVTEHDWANAHLIAAAPDLFVTLEALFNNGELRGLGVAEIEEVQNLLKKAKGEL